MATEKENNGLAIVVAFFLGGLTGAVFSLLFAPASGKETREKIRGVSIDAKERTVEAAQKAKEFATEKVSGLVHQGRERIQDAGESVKAAVEAGKTAFVQKKSELTEAISHINIRRKADEEAEEAEEAAS
jgi:gas vesicle protein